MISLGRIPTFSIDRGLNFNTSLEFQHQTSSEVQYLHIGSAWTACTTYRRRIVPFGSTSYSVYLYAQYSSFSVGDCSTNYTLTIGGYSGNAGDAMTNQDGQQFETYDVTHSSWYTHLNCAGYFGGGFWYKGCSYVKITASPPCFFTWNSVYLNTACNHITPSDYKNSHTISVTAKFVCCVRPCNVWYHSNRNLFLIEQCQATRISCQTHNLEHIIIHANKTI